MTKLKDITLETFIDLEEELEETTTSSATPGYSPKNAFKARKKQKPIIDVELNESLITESNDWDSMNPKQKVGTHIKSVVSELKKIDKVLKEAEKIKTEGDLNSSSYWKRTTRGLSQIQDSIVKLGHRIKRLQS